MGESTRDKLLRGARCDPKSPRAVPAPVPVPIAGQGLRGSGRPKPPARGEHPAPRPAGAARGSLSALLGLEPFPK